MDVDGDAGQPAGLAGAAATEVTPVPPATSAAPADVVTSVLAANGAAQPGPPAKRLRVDDGAGGDEDGVGSVSATTLQQLLLQSNSV